MKAGSEKAKRKLTPRQSRFVDEYLKDLNATKASIRAGYSEACTEGYYVYFLICSLTKQIFYVGKGKGRRAWSHKRDAVAGKEESNYVKSARINKIIKDGGDIQVFIFDSNLSETNAFIVERSLIRILRDTLTNMSGGTVSSIESNIERAKILLSRVIPYDQWIVSVSPEHIKLLTGWNGSPKNWHESFVKSLEKLAGLRE